MENEKLKHGLIVGITPYFLDKVSFWFEKNLKEILRAAKTQPFFRDNAVFLEKGKNYNFSELLKKLDETGYERVFKISDPGEFSQKGGVIDIFPVNTMQAVRLDFLGNKIDSIELLDVKIADEKKSKDILKKRLKSQKIFSDIKGLKPGDYLAHLDHGIARFSGIENSAYYALEYAKGDKLYVPIGLERKLSRYVGFIDPKISRLGSNLWQKTKRKIKEEVEKLAKELLALYAKKEAAKRTPYFEDKEMEGQLASGFPYEETADQITCLEDIKNDLSQERPMDRLVCGDVGFGKTEIAMRTALLAAINSRQTALICPTTILASQHFNNFKERFKNLPVKISIMSRLQTKKEQRKIINALKEGRTDIVIGTHRVLSDDVFFAEGESASGGKNLQLLIIDDEQKFGVKQKEKLRQLKSSLDILSLSATPIPRTIYLALSSFKNISLIQTPPKGRKAINTKILPYGRKTIKSAISFELERNGQVYYLHNLIKTIEKTKQDLQKLVPASKIGAVHGRMQEKQLIKIMNDFQKEKFNVLVATTIIENGLDLPNVNTIIIEDATRLGLSQAHQIRGRIGRSDRESFAYMFYPPKFPENKKSGKANERLKILKEARELGAGYHIAMKDLELRGAGNILGKEQSGAVNKIGLNLYCQILSEAVEKLKEF